MKQLMATITKARSASAGTALLFVTLATGCGSSDAGSADDGGASDGQATSAQDDGGNVTADGQATGHDGNGGAPNDGSVNVGDGAAVGAPLVVNLGGAAGFVILAQSGIATVPTSAVTGDLGISPMSATSITGFPLTADATNVFSTTPQLTGKVYAANYAAPTPANLTAAISDMHTAFTDAAGRAPNVTELGAGNIGGKTLGPGVYKWSSGLTIPTDLALTGSATDVWIFQIAQTLTMSSATKVTLAGGALAQNVFWEVASSVDLGTTAHIEGTILAKTAITLRTGASIHGRLMAQTAVNIEGSTVVQP